jgi:AraC-like DNA-binding protein
MKKLPRDTTHELHIKNMNSRCCFRLIRLEFETLGIQIHELKAGYAKVCFNANKLTLEKIDAVLQNSGMSLISNPELILLEKIKQAVIELVHYMNNSDSIARKSDYLVEKLHMSYRQISAVFRKYEPITLERFIILHKIERIKDLIDSEEYTLSEIAYMMDYSSVQYLSNLFKKEVGVSVSEYKQNPQDYKKMWDELY